MTVDPEHEATADLLGAYALDAVDHIEAENIAAHLAGCPRCRAELNEHRTVVGLFSYSGAEAPHNVWERITQVTAAPVSDRSNQVRGPASRTRLRRRGRHGSGYPFSIAVGAVAAAAVLIVGMQTGQFMHTRTSGSPLQADPAAVITAVGSPGARLVRLASGIGANDGGTGPATTAVLLVDGTGYLLGSHLAPLPAGETYQLWGQVGNEMVSYGLLGAKPGVFVFRAGSNLSRLALTAETGGGVVVSHNVAVLSGPVPIPT